MNQKSGNWSGFKIPTYVGLIASIVLKRRKILVYWIHVILFWFFSEENPNEGHALFTFFRPSQSSSESLFVLRYGNYFHPLLRRAQDREPSSESEEEQQPDHELERTCKECFRVFGNRGSMIAHMSTHKTRSCPHCSLEFFPTESESAAVQLNHHVYNCKSQMTRPPKLKEPTKVVYSKNEFQYFSGKNLVYVLSLCVPVGFVPDKVISGSLESFVDGQSSEQSCNVLSRIMVRWQIQTLIQKSSDFCCSTLSSYFSCCSIRIVPHFGVIIESPSIERPECSE